MDNELICCKCGIAMQQRKACFSYMGYSFNTELPCCPRCGQVYIDEDVAAGKMAEVEMALEEK